MNINARSILNKLDTFEDLLLDRDPDIVSVTETWLSSPIHSQEIAPPNYSVIKKDRSSRGGGVALLIKKSIPFAHLPTVEEAEAVFCKILCNGNPIITGCVYRSPSSGHECIEVLQEFMQQHARNSRVILMGDFNLPDFNWATMHYTSFASNALVDLMLNFNLQQVVPQPTRTQGSTANILDLIFLSTHFSASHHPGSYY